MRDFPRLVFLLVLLRDFLRLVLFLLLVYSGADTLYVELVYSHTHRHTEGLVCWYGLLNKINPFHWVA